MIVQNLVVCVHLRRVGMKFNEHISKYVICSVSLECRALVPKIFTLQCICVVLIEHELRPYAVTVCSWECTVINALYVKFLEVAFHFGLIIFCLIFFLLFSLM